MSIETQRREDQRACSRLAKVNFSLEPAELQPRIARSGRTRAEAYWHLGRYTFSVLSGQYEKQHGEVFSDRVRTAGMAGMDVSARFLSLSPDTYRDYCEGRVMRPSLEQLRATLKRSTKTVQRFQAIPDYQQTVETELGLLEYDSGRFSLPGFRFEETGQGLSFAVDDERFSELTETLEYRDELPRHLQRCPAKKVMERCWPAMVDLATDTPELFAHDLGVVEAEYRQPLSQVGLASIYLCGE